MFKFGSPQEWGLLAAGVVATFPGVEHKPRRVRVELNSRDPAGVYMCLPDRRVLLRRVDGLASVEFVARGAVDLVADGDVWIRTSDGQQLAVEGLAPSMTGPVTRRVIDPNVQAAMYLVRQSREMLTEARDTMSQIKRMRVHDAKRQVAADAARQAARAAKVGSGEAGGSAGDEGGSAASAGASDVSGGNPGDGRSSVSGVEPVSGAAKQGGSGERKRDGAAVRGPSGAGAKGA